MYMNNDIRGRIGSKRRIHQHTLGGKCRLPISLGPLMKRR